MDEHFYDEYSDDSYDLIVFDEFYKQKEYTFLNKFVEGSPIFIRAKGSQKYKNSNLPIVILSNYTISECFDKPVAVETMKSRFNQVFLSEPFDLDHISFDLAEMDDETLNRVGATVTYTNDSGARVNSDGTPYAACLTPPTHIVLDDEEETQDTSNLYPAGALRTDVDLSEMGPPLIVPRSTMTPNQFSMDVIKKMSALLNEDSQEDSPDPEMSQEI